MSAKYLLPSLPPLTQELEWTSPEVSSQPWDAAQRLEVIHTSLMNIQMDWVCTNFPHSFPLSESEDDFPQKVPAGPRLSSVTHCGHPVTYFPLSALAERIPMAPLCHHRHLRVRIEAQ